MPHMYKKTFKGRTYWYVRETRRVGRKVQVKWQKYLSTAETILSRLEEAERLLYNEQFKVPAARCR